MKYKTLYKQTSTGKVFEWWMQSDVDRYRTLFNYVGGEITASNWTYPTPKNLGKANETTAEQQVKLEIEAAYKKKLAQGKYCEDITDLMNAKNSYFSPMLANKFNPDKIDKHFYIQPKFNGVRCIANADGLWSRKGKQFVNTPHIEEGLRAFFGRFPTVTLDGELYNHEYKNDFNTLISSIRKQKPTAATQAKSKDVVKFYVYDMHDTLFPNLSFGDRYEDLKTFFNTDIDKLGEAEHFVLSPTYRSSEIRSAKALHERNKANGYEGSIIRLDVPYANKRSDALMKYKDFQDAEFEILDIEEGKGNWSGVAKKVKLKLPDGVTSAAGKDYFHAGVKGNKEYCLNLLKNKKDLIGSQGTVMYFDLTPDGVPLFPIFQVVRDYE